MARKDQTYAKNWIGRSYGGEIEFAVKGKDVTFKVFTTRADTIFGVSYVVLAPESPLVDLVVTPEQKEAVEEYKEKSAKATEIDRLSSTREKTGVLTGSYAINPINGREVPILVADYVIASYGTGAVMGVAAHDERDFVFAQKLGLPVERVIKGKDGQNDDLPFCEYGILCNSGEFDGMTSEEGKLAILKKLESMGKGGLKTNYRLRDWLISRQRYWGAPIPIIHCDHCGDVPVPEKDLPVLLPHNVNFTPDGESPLKKCKEFEDTVCPVCGRPANAMRTRSIRLCVPVGIFEIPRRTQCGKTVRQRVDKQDAPRRQVYRRCGTRLYAPPLRALLHQGVERYGLSRF